MLANLIVRPQRPEWVDAAPKRFAWGIGLVMVMISCFMMGWFALTGLLPLVLCGICISFLFLESAFGICIGCEIAMRFGKTKPRLCPGDVCNYTPPAKAK
jgi:cobalamin biosynthesis protein CobD/CbiB